MRYSPFAILVILTSGQVAYGQFYVNNRAATVEESRARGLSEVTRARSQAAIDSADARIRRAEARSRELDNRLKATKTYFEMRNINREQRFGTQEERAERRRRNNERRYAAAARRGDPNQLDYDQLDPVTGKISWPRALRSEAFDELRERIDELFAQRASYGGQASAETRYAIKDAMDDFEDALRAEIRNIPTQQFLDARRFIRALAYQAERS